MSKPNYEVSLTDLGNTGRLLIEWITPKEDVNKVTAFPIHLPSSVEDGNGNIFEYKNPNSNKTETLVMRPPLYSRRLDNKVERAQAVYILQCRDAGVFVKMGSNITITNTETKAKQRTEAQRKWATLLIRVEQYVSDPMKLIDLAANMGIDYKRNSSAVVEEQIYDQVNAFPDKVMDILDSPNFETKSLIFADLDKKGTIKEGEGGYWFGQTWLGDINKAVDKIKENPQWLETLRRETGRTGGSKIEHTEEEAEGDVVTEKKTKNKGNA